MNVQELARRLGASVDSSLDLDVTGVAPLDEARPTEVTFLSNPSYVRKLKDTRAAAVLVAPDFSGECPVPTLRVANPYLAFAKAIAFFYAAPVQPPGVHATAVLGAGCVLGKDVSIGAYVVLGDHVTVGDGCVIHPHCTIYSGATLGAGCLLHAHVTVREHVRLGNGVVLQNGAVIGADGFGFAPRGDGTWHKIPQAGTVVLGDDVEVQANACIDRATVGATTVGKGTKIDNLVQVAHGCQIGEHSILCGQVGLAGTTKIGDRTTLAGQVGTAGHLSIGNDVTIAAQSGVMADVPDGGYWGGSPALDTRELRGIMFQYLRLPELAKRVKALEKALPASAEPPPAAGA